MQATELLRSIDDPALDRDTRALRRCLLAEELEQQGNYGGARSALGMLWRGVGERPATEGLSETTSAYLFLRVGTLSGWLGSAGQLAGSQERAKNLLTEAADRFERCGLRHEATRSQVELAWCYFREGAYGEARLYLDQALQRLDDAAVSFSPGDLNELKALALLRLAIVERMENRLYEALTILNRTASLLGPVQNDLLKGNFHNTRANVLKNLALREETGDYSDRAFIEYAAASIHFERAGHARHRSVVENNLGLLYLGKRQLGEAQEHIERARRLAASLNDRYLVAQFDDSRAQLYLEQSRLAEAERAAVAATRALETGGEQGALAESLITYGRVAARLNKQDLARSLLGRARETAEIVGDLECAGRACLTLFEELAAALTEEEMRQTFGEADRFLEGTDLKEIKERLLRCAKAIIRLGERPVGESQPSAPLFIHAEEATRQLLRQAERVATTDKAALITGETGTGKEVLAGLIHAWSGRKGRLVALNCAALNESIVESQLFGHRRGSFTDAVEDFPGAAVEARGGTLFLDEIGELSPRLQAKLLRLVEYKEILPVGAAQGERIDVRIIAATNKDLREQVRRGLFREDLYYRLAGLHLHIAPLRERPADAAAITRAFIAEFNALYKKEVAFTADAVQALTTLPLPGNVRELRGLLEKSFIFAGEQQQITRADVETLALRSDPSRGDLADQWRNLSLPDEVRRFEATMIARALEAFGGNVTQTANALGLSHQALSYMLDGRHQGLREQFCAKPKRGRSIIKGAPTGGGSRRPRTKVTREH